jgi:hypothetical protein
MYRAIEQAFQFLVDRHAFNRAVANDPGSYRSPTLSITPSFNERDGFETDLEFPGRGAEKIAVGTILAALSSVACHDLATQSSFLSLNLGKLTALPAELYDDLRNLRFWHAPRWHRDWGKGIKLGRNSIAAERARLARVREYFGDIIPAEPGSERDVPVA